MDRVQYLRFYTSLINIFGTILKVQLYTDMCNIERTLMKGQVNAILRL